MPKRHIAIIPVKKARRLIPKIKAEKDDCYYLSNDYEQLIVLRAALNGGIKIHTLEKLFEEEFARGKQAILNEFLNVNTRLNSFEWWGNQIACKSTPATPLLRNIVYLLCAQKIIADTSRDLIFITDSPAVAHCLFQYSKEMNCAIVNHHTSVNDVFTKIKRYIYYSAQIVSFTVKSIESRRYALKSVNPLPEKRKKAQKRVVVRTWITDNTFDADGKYNDRNFGNLTQWLQSKGYEVWTLPMFFNLGKNKKKRYECIGKEKGTFLVPEHYLSMSDYIDVLRGSYQGFCKPIEGVRMEGLDVSPIFNESLRELGFNVELSLLNLCVPMLRRLGQAGIQIDGFYYPFECNSPENQFLLGCRRYFPEAKIIGFQHTTFFPNQLAYHLAPGEEKIHPLPDKIICSGPKYKQLHQEAGFPEDRLVAGPNLRFKAMNSRSLPERAPSKDGKRMLLLPLTFGYDLAFDLLMKVNEAVHGSEDCAVCIRPHPLLDKERLINFMRRINMNHYEIAESGTIQDWMARSYAIISTGGSITTLEAMAMGVPVIRVIPDNTFYYEPFHLDGYPLPAVSSAEEIKEQLIRLGLDTEWSEDIWEEIGERVLTNYFTKPDEENLKNFLTDAKEEQECLLPR